MLDRNSAAELSFRLFLQSLQSDNPQNLSSLGIAVDEIRAIEGMTLKQLQHLARFGSQYLELRINRTHFCRALAHVQNQNLSQAQRQSLQDQLVLRGAPMEMLRTLVGMDRREFSELRRRHGIHGKGRPRTPTEGELEVLYRNWRETAALPDAERYLALAEATGLSLAVIWAETHELRGGLGEVAP